jgi:cell fate (sporulation/competence/biofilm development) regulator YlbF (YheA/YmcA/DUF963 family)
VDLIQDRAREVGRLISQTEEYRALKRANDRLSDDREAVTTINRLSELEGELANLLRSGREPGEEEQREYEQLVETLQQMTVYQGVVAAQSNFDRLMQRINEEIAQGIQAGDQSRIILP